MNTREHPLLTGLSERRSIRKFTDAPISRETLVKILEAGRWAPSGLNKQPWRFLVINNTDPRHEALQRCTQFNQIIQSAATCICVLLQRSAMYNAMKDHHGAGACIQNMLLATHALGLGAVWLGEISNDQTKSLAALALNPHEYELQAVIAVGYPAEEPCSKRKPLATLLLEELT